MSELRKQVEDAYSLRIPVLQEIVPQIQKDLEKVLKEQARIDRISVRSKALDRFVEKAFKVTKEGKLKYSDPLHQIQDQIGARIVVFYLDDVERISKLLLEWYTKIEEIVVEPASESEFGYVGRHFILTIPEEFNEGKSPKFFELQVKTIFQHAWGECAHDLIYKPPIPITVDQRKRVAYAAAQAWGADQIFHGLSGEILKANT